MKALKLKSLWGAGITCAIVVGALHLQSVTQAAPGNSQSANKVQICHFPPGNPANVQLITINANALNAHLAHGDMTDLEACQERCGQLKCNDGNVCTLDDCDANNQCIPVVDRPLISCDDDDARTDDDRDPATGCVHEDISASCDDGNACTADSCDAEVGCVSAPAAPSLKAAITKQLVGLGDDSLTIEITTLTNPPYLPAVVGSGHPSGFMLESLSTVSCALEAGPRYRCHHEAKLIATTACTGTGNYQMMLEFDCSPEDCSECNTAVISFRLTTENFC